MLHMPGEGERHGVGDSETVIKAGSAETGGTFFLSETTLAPEFPGPPPHRHERLHDMFYVLEGTLTMRLGDETCELGPGSFVWFPEGMMMEHGATQDNDVTLLFITNKPFDIHYSFEDKQQQ